MKKNNKGFTLVELLAVIVILAIIMAFAIPNIYKVINKNKENNYEQLKETIVSATKTYISDYRYDISLNEDKITNINGLEITGSKILVSSLVDEGNIKTTKEGIILNPKNKNQCLNLLESYIKVTYNETKKDYIYGYSENDTEVNSDFYLKWVEKETDDKKINSQCYYTEKTIIKPTDAICEKAFYDGEEKELVKNTNKGYTVTNQYQVEVGKYNVYLNLNEGYVWSDGTREQVTIECSIQPITLTVKFNPNEGILASTEKEKTVTYKKEYGDLPVPTRPGYTFDGWYTKTDGGSKVENDTIVTNKEEHTLFAHWTANKAIVTINKNGNPWSNSGINVALYLDNNSKHVATVNDSTITWSGVESGTYNVFASKNANDKNILVYTGRDINVSTTGNATINYYDLKLNKGTGISEVSGARTYLNNQTVEIDVKTSDGYTFTNWTTMDNTPISVEKNPKITLDKATTLTANANPNTYTVNFYDNRYYLNKASQVISVLNDRIFYKRYDDPCLVAIYYDGTYTGPLLVGKTANSVAYYESYSGNTHTSTSTFTYNGTTYYYSTWSNVIKGNYSDSSGLIYRLKYSNSTVSSREEAAKKLLSEYLLTSSQTFSYGTSQKLKVNEYTNSGYSFKGWSKTPTGDKTYSNREEVINLTTKNNDIINLYALWQPNTYTLTYNANEGQISTSTKTVTYGTVYGTLLEPTREGYTFDGWYTEKIGGTKINNTSVVTLAKNHTIYAHWKGITNTVIVNYQNNILDENIEDWELYGESTINYANGSNGKPGVKLHSGNHFYDINYYGIKVPIIGDKELNVGYQYCITVLKKKETDANFDSTAALRYSAPTLNASGAIINNNDGHFINIKEGIYNETPEEFCSTGNIINTNYSSWPYAYVNLNRQNTGSLYISDIRMDKTESIEFTNGESTLPSSPTRTGYIFDGWYNTPDTPTVVIGAREHTANRRTILTNLEPGTTYTVSMDSASLNASYSGEFTVLVYDNTTSTTLKTYTKSFSSSNISFNVECPSTATTGNDLRLFFYAGIKGSTSGNTAIFNNVWIRKSGEKRNRYTDSSLVEPDTNYKEVFTKLDNYKVNKVYAHWTPNPETIQTSKVSFNPNGGSVSPTYKTVTYLSQYGELPIPTRTGYSFTGWYTKTDGGSKVENDTIVTKITDHTLYARWNPIESIVTFDPNGGTVTISNKTVSYDSEYGELPRPTRTGYSFTGWYTKTDGGSKVENDTIVTKIADHTLYARWTANTANICYHVNGGTINSDTYSLSNSLVYKDGSIATTPWNYGKASLNLGNVVGTFGLKKTGHHIDGSKAWLLNSTSGKEITSYETTDSTVLGYFNNLVKSSTGVTITMYANWQPNTYYVKYNGNGATSGSMNNSTHTYGTAKNLTANGFSKIGYTFAGWNTKEDGSGTSYSNQQSVTQLTSTNEGTVNLYAQWKAVTTTVWTNGTIEAYGSSDTPQPVTIGKFDLSGFKSFSLECKTKNPNFNGIKYKLGINISIDNNIITSFVDLDRAESHKVCTGSVKIPTNYRNGNRKITVERYGHDGATYIRECNFILRIEEGDREGSINGLGSGLGSTCG